MLRPLVFLLLLLALSSLAHANLLSNPSFENNAAGWEGITAAQITSADAHSGSRALRLTSSLQAAQGWIPLATGLVYSATVWFKWHSFGFSDWGFNHFSIVNDDWSAAARILSLHDRCPSGTWTKFALTFTATHAAVRVELGVYGPQSPVHILFDDVSLVPRLTNLPPLVAPSASALSGSVPFTVNFSANGDDPDGAIAHYAWDFGDGAAAREALTRHTFIQRGSFPVRLTVWDNDGSLVSSTLTITVSDTAAPVLTLAPAQSLSTTNHFLQLAGSATAGASPLARLVWDNLSTVDAGLVPLSSALTQNWTATLPLKPGSNHLFFTLHDSAGRVSSLPAHCYRAFGPPRITAVSSNAAILPCFAPYHLTFDVLTEAPSSFFCYDPAPPPGVQPNLGISVLALMRDPQQHLFSHPAFWARQASRHGDRYIHSTNTAWHFRFTPTLTGYYDVTLAATDYRGSVTHYVGRLLVTNSNARGFVVVSTNDPRYFHFMNGDIFWPIGPVMSDYPSAAAHGLNFSRFWLGGIGMYSANWSRWISSAELHGNEGFMARFTYLRSLPGTELSHEIFYPQGYRIWLGFLDNLFAARLSPGQLYQIKLRLRCENIAGPAHPGYPWGFTVRNGGWPEPSMHAFWASMRARPALIPHITGSRPWHTVLTNFVAESNPAYLDDLFLYLDNVTSGAVYVETFSIRPVFPDLSLGPELVRNPRADWHTYAEQRPAAFLDDLLSSGALYGIYHKLVVQDKNDWIPNHLTDIGLFTYPGHGYFQRPGTKAAWLQEQWWRYLTARWGFSPSVHSWELCNEGSPTDPAHWARAQEFGAFFRHHNAHPQLKTTSFWATWQPAFWGNSNLYPDVDYADIHTYVTGSDPLQYDMVAWHILEATNAAATPVGKPVIRAETGIYAEPGFSTLSASNNPGIWYHNLLWPQLGAPALFEPGYWFSEHFARINQHAVTRPFADFVRQLRFHEGGYHHLSYVCSNPLLRVIGQAHLTGNHAVLWLQNARHTWRNLMGLSGAQPVTPQNADLFLRLSPNATYLAQYWDTYSGAFFSSQTLEANSSGDLFLPVRALTNDFAAVLTLIPEPTSCITLPAALFLFLSLRRHRHYPR